MSGLRIVIVGLGYVGLPLGIALAKRFDVTGFDIDRDRVGELRAGKDRTGEVPADTLTDSKLRLTNDAGDIAGGDVYIVTVPTPVDEANRPDLGALLSATRTIAAALDASRRPTVIYESTVYPGVTEGICGSELEKISGLCRGSDFRLGYSPERINPGDREHSVDRITKVIAGEDADVLAQMSDIYGAITSGGVFAAASIKAAEGAKAIENAQRDINIAFMNEVAQLFARIDVSVWDVLEAARTKWNFLPFEPGLVGGHCIGVDPYYLAFLAEQLGHDPQVILAGRNTNDGMARWIADIIHERRGGRAGRALVLGLTFKENVPDLRNSRSFDLINRLEYLGYSVDAADCVADPEELKRDFGVTSVDPDGRSYDLVVAAVGHRDYRDWDAARLERLVADGGMLADIKGIWRDRALDPSIERWTL